MIVFGGDRRIDDVAKSLEIGGKLEDGICRARLGPAMLHRRSGFTTALGILPSLHRVALRVAGRTIEDDALELLIAV